MDSATYFAEASVTFWTRIVGQIARFVEQASSVPRPGQTASVSTHTVITARKYIAAEKRWVDLGVLFDDEASRAER